jgi:ferredoxin
VFRHNNNELNPFKCIACGACAAKCPTQALEIAKEV